MPKSRYFSEIIFNPKSDTIADRLNELASDNWELVSIINQGSNVIIVMRKDTP